tara:strand:- start:40 stop:570 length:531 start_codon:yes stop_codon:yes gene_type:complete
MLKFKKNKVKNICLIGFMGSGKSLIGRELAQKYKIKFFDTDNEIEKSVGKSINNIFRDNGESYFRNIEEEICINLIKKQNCIISMGGGSINSIKVRDMIKKNSFSIYLKVNKIILFERLKNSKKRPLLNKKNKFKVIEELYDKRKIFYNDADLIIENNNDKHDIINIIMSNISFYE